VASLVNRKHATAIKTQVAYETAPVRFVVNATFCQSGLAYTIRRYALPIIARPITRYFSIFFSPSVLCLSAVN